ncbi:isoaspartyl peptidase/L-asparaginase [Clarias magur]|uniref:Isoaspartyl peptidase/L-asparaginase n=1 Tax=Clarias magur TaxID=1594786 RepID=A0A8J5C9Y8_CLAMG|nr:isoaspartyl peptidase/L-asparaginase [Clarias magur]
MPPLSGRRNSQWDRSPSGARILRTETRTHSFENGARRARAPPLISSLQSERTAHGGAGYIPKEQAESASVGVREATRKGYAILKSGGSAVDAVVEAVTILENNPNFNAGRGSVLNIKGEVEMDALVMDGCTLACGAVAAVKKVANPIQLARLVMDKTNHVCLAADGASQFARAMGIPEVPGESLITDYAIKRWQDNLLPDADPVQAQMGKMGTVGAVAVDVQGNVACATSTGGIINKMEGRVGDTPCVGCGAYADNQIGAVAPTGHGEAIMKVVLSRQILFHMEQGKSPEEASDLSLDYMQKRVSGLGGVVVVDPKGTWAARFSSQQMPWAAAQQEQLHYGVFLGENIIEPV